MRKIAASYLFPVNQPPLKNGILIIDDNGYIEKVIDTKGNLKEEANLEFYNGILTPGFVNAHCHLELSHLYKKTTQGKGLSEFLKSINKKRAEPEEIIVEKAKQADFEMFQQGIVAVGDVSNEKDTMILKKSSKLYYHTFIEAFGFHPERAEKAFNKAKKIFTAYLNENMNCSITPHSAYSVSDPLFELIKMHNEKNTSIISIHNQESDAENQLFIDGEGAISDHFKKNLGINFEHFIPTGNSSLFSVMNKLPAKNHILFIHNIYTEKKDLKIIKKTFIPDNLFFVVCPNSNLYIENRLPNLYNFNENYLTICIGTDSLASNDKLSILSELITIQQYYPNIDLEELIKWATINGAKALKKEDTFGSFEKGKKPGVNLLENIDLKHLKLKPDSRIKKLA